MSHALEYIGSALGIMGAALLATNTRFSRYGWIAFLASNFALIGLFIQTRSYGLLAQQACFTATSLLGIWRSGFIPSRLPKPNPSAEQGA